MSHILKYGLLFLVLSCQGKLKSENVIDSIMKGYAGRRMALLPLIQANDSVSKIYLKSLMEYVEEESRESMYSGYTTAERRKRAATEGSRSDWYNGFYCPKGVFSMYLVYCVLLKDTAFCCKIGVWHKTKNDSTFVKFFVENYKGEFEFTGRWHFNRMSAVFSEWYKTNESRSIEQMRASLPFSGSAYSWSCYSSNMVKLD